MPFNLPVSIPQDSGYKIARSLRFNPADTPWLTRTPAVAGNQKTFTVSFWAKRSLLGAFPQWLFHTYVDANNSISMWWNHVTPIDSLGLQVFIGGVAKLSKIPGTVFRDTSAWYHVCWSVNTAPATPTQVLEINGVTITDYSGGNVLTLASGENMPINVPGAINWIGRYGTSAVNHCGCYLADFHLIDGYAQPASAFAQTDPVTGVWTPKAYAGLYGPNGVKLDFSNNATAATLGNDASGMSNLLGASDAFNNGSFWAPGNNASLNSGQADPFGGLGAYTLVVGGSTANPYVSYNTALVRGPVGQVTTFTVYALQGSVGTATIYNGNANGGWGIFDLVNATVLDQGVIGTGSNVSAKISTVIGNWRKCSVTVTHNTAGDDRVLIYSPSTSTANGNGFTIFRAGLTGGSAIPIENQYTNGTAIANKNFTTANFSVTAGVGDDSLVDTPTNYGTDSGVGGEVRGNYCTLNPLDCQAAANIVLSNGNLAATSMNAAAYGSTRSTFRSNTGKWYWECTVSALGAGAVAYTGIWGNTTVLAGSTASDYVGSTLDSFAYVSSGQKASNTVHTAYGAAFTVGDVIGTSFDADVGLLTFYKNGVSQGTAFSGFIPNDFYSPAFSAWKNTTTAVLDVNFGQRPFAFAAPAGFKALCTQNLPTPAIKRGDDYMTVNLRTGTGAAFSVTGKRFQPDLVWIKARPVAYSHYVFDTTRGVFKYLSTDATAVEGTAGDTLTAFNADGYSGGNNSVIAENTRGFVDWLWKKGVVPGFDVVPYTGSGANRTISHGLGVAPKLMIVKSRSGAVNWIVYHQDILATKYLSLNQTIAAATLATIWNNTAPTSSVFSLGTDASVNANAATFVNYLFADVPGFSKFGSYTGNGNADGPFVWTGFRPGWVLVKETAGTGVDSWWVQDTARVPSNPVNNPLHPDLGNAEPGANTIFSFDFLSNGFKLRTDFGSVNASGGTYIFAAFAEHPFKYARAR